MTTIDGKKLWEEVQANRARLRSCDRHLIDGAAYQFGKRLRCQKCQGDISASDVLNYMAGYAAHGGDPNDIWPGYGEEKSPAL